MNQIQICQRRLDHHDVGTLLDVQRHLAQRLVRVRRVHLVAAPVAELRRAFGGLAERPVKCRRKFGRIAHDRRVGKTVLVQRRADGGHAPVHHVARRNDVRASLGMTRCRGCEQLECRVIQNLDWPRHLAGSAMHDAAMSVLHILAQAHVRDDQQRRQFLFQQPHGLLDDSIFGERARSLGVLFIRDAEQQDRRDAERMDARGLAQQFIRRKLEDARHGIDGLAQFAPGAGEKRQDQMLHAQARFADQFPQRGR